MGKFFSRFLLLLLVTVVSLIIYLSYFGISTDKFDDLIKNKANEVNQNVELEFQKTKIHLNIKELNLVVKLQNSKVLIRGNAIELSKLDLFLSLKSFFSSDFLLKRAEVAFIENDIKDLTKITNIFLPKFVNKKLNKIFAKGNIRGEFIIPFETDGSIGKDYGFTGKISDASINLTKEFSIKNLTTEISNLEDNNTKGFEIIIKKGSIYDLELVGTTINLKREKNEIKIKSLLRTNGKLNFSQIKKISALFGLNISNFKDINGTADVKTNINFDLDKQFSVKNLSYSMDGDIAYFEIHTDEKRIIKKYLPKYDSKIILKDTHIRLINSKSDHNTELSGFVKIEEDFDSFKIKEVYNYDKKSFKVDGIIDLTNSQVKVSQLNYKKKSGKKSEVSFNINFVLNKYYNINNLNFLAERNKINLSDIKLNKKFEVLDFKKLEIKTFLNEIKNNDFLVKKSEKVIISGQVFDAQPLLESLYKKSDKKTFSKNFSSEIKINFDKALTGTNDDIFNFAMIASVNKGSYVKLSSKGIFSENEIVEMSIYQVDNDKKTLQVVSDRARPFVKNFDFIKGFEGGKLEYESIISKKGSNSNLLITDFKVSKVPALAKLLTLASLQGIADTLSGEGIRFESFEMKSNSEGNVINIEDALAMGPAVSILLEGYVDKGKIVSLRGTLIPATKLNSIIASIPLVGDILVGKKTGEGVVGVSFKMKGPPKDIKTTVNPIKTLTPRFIVRAIEKMKKQKKEEIK
jgi:hypothetical protein